MKIGPTRRLRRCLTLLAAVAAIAAATPARAVTLPARPITEVHLVKAQHEGLRFHWQAVVGEYGGAFVLRRRGVRPSVDVVRPASPRQRAYEAWWHAPAASGIYELRYRGARGAESVLATLVVNCHSLDSGCPAQGEPQWRPPLAAPAFAPMPAAPLAWRPAEPAARVASVPRKPLLPPPRNASRA